MAGHTLVPAEGTLGYDRVMSSNRKPYRTKDGYLAILPYSTKHWIRFFEISDRPDLAADSRVIDPVRRSEHIDELYALVAEITPTKSTDQWRALLSAQDIPCATVNSLQDLLSDAHLQAAEMFQRVEDPRMGPLKIVRSPFEVDGELSFEKKTDAVAPALGDHSGEILSELNYTEAEIQTLVADGVVVSQQ
jgi:crotonobetainyl-CoA:carnitine CoA-transferase CaiB-like acyl-CoA transferase